MPTIFSICSTDPRMLGMVEAQLPQHRERRFPPTLTLAMFLGQIMSADGSCQNAVNEAIVARLLAGMNPGSANTSGYCQARQRLPQEMVRTLARHSGALLGARDHLVWWTKPARPGWMSVEAYRSYPGEIEVREVKVGKKVLVSTLLSPRNTPKAALGELFWQRWNAELDLRNIETTLGMEALSCKTPQMCEKEFWAYLLAYNLIRLLMAEAALRADVLPRQLSFKHTLQIWAAWSQWQFLSASGEDTVNLFVLIAQIRVADRPGRAEPRAVKRRPKPYPRLKKPRRKARMEIERLGLAKKLRP